MTCSGAVWYRKDISKNESLGGEMDPNAAWETVLENYVSGDLDTAAEHALHLHDWLRNGGFFPTNVEDIAEFEQVMTEVIDHAHETGLDV